jgi:hypothetical protein
MLACGGAVLAEQARMLLCGVAVREEMGLMGRKTKINMACLPVPAGQPGSSTCVAWVSS